MVSPRLEEVAVTPGHSTVECQDFAFRLAWLKIIFRGLGRPVFGTWTIDLFVSFRFFLEMSGWCDPRLTTELVRYLAPIGRARSGMRLAKAKAARGADMAASMGCQVELVDNDQRVPSQAPPGVVWSKAGRAD
jgi:hypothetical protein